MLYATTVAVDAWTSAFRTRWIRSILTNRYAVRRDFYIPATSRAIGYFVGIECLSAVAFLLPILTMLTRRIGYFARTGDLLGTGGGDGCTGTWTNKLHYENSLTDEGEFIDVAGVAGTNLSGYSILGQQGQPQRRSKRGYDGG